MTLKVISIEEVQGDDETQAERVPRVSSLIAHSGHHDALVVVGVLPNGHAFKPTTAADRDALMRYLSALDYQDEPPRFSRLVAMFVDDLDCATLAEIKEAMKDCKEARTDLAGRISKRAAIADVENLLGAHSRRF